MRVLMLLSNPYRPDYRVEREAKALKEEGNEITILAWDREGSHETRETINGVSVLRVGPKARYNVPLDLLAKLPMFWLRGFLRTLRLDVDVVHAHDLDTLILGVFVSSIRSVKLVYDAHELYWAMIENSVPGWLKRLIERVERRLVKKADVVMTVTPQLAQLLESYGARDVEIVMNCEEIRKPDEKRVEGIRKELLKGGKSVVLYAGMLEPSRNLETLISLFGKLDNDEVRLAVGGTGSLVSELTELARKTRNVDYIGWIASRDMFDYVSASDLMVLIHDPRNANIRIGISARLFNAMAAGKPVIVSEGTGNADITIEEDIGVVVPFDDAERISEAILSLLKDEKRMNEVSENGKRAARERYNWERMKRRLIRTYRIVGAD
jgi:glycosyltransferase involved in cell wall biosynthesis